MIYFVKEFSSTSRRHIIELFIAMGLECRILGEHYNKITVNKNDIVVSWNRPPSAEPVLSFFEQRGATALIMENPYFTNTAKKHYAISIGYHNCFSKSLPSAGSHRLDQFLQNFVPNRPYLGNNILIVSQSKRFNGSAFGAPTMTQPSNWDSNIIKMARTYSDKPIVFRTHPKHRNIELKQTLRKITSNISYSDGEAVDLAKDFENSFCMVTHNSNAIVEALIADVPIVATSKAILAKDCCNFGINSLKNIKYFSEKERLTTLARFAANQWSVDEIRSGKLFHDLGIYK